MAKRGLAVCVLAVLAAAYCPAQRQTIQKGSGRRIDVRIVGSLTDSRELPIAGATIGLARWDAAVWQPLARTSATGAFELSVGLQVGDYKVIAAFDRFAIASGNVKVRATAGRTLKVYLRPPEYEARSDAPPDPTPPPGLLPPGSFAPPPPSLEASQAVASSDNDARPEPKPGNEELVNVFYVTNRAPTAGRPAYYSDRPFIQMKTSYGVCSVRMPPVHLPGRIERPSIWRFERVEDVDKHIVIAKRELAEGSSAFQGERRGGPYLHPWLQCRLRRCRAPNGAVVPRSEVRRRADSVQLARPGRMVAIPGGRGRSGCFRAPARRVPGTNYGGQSAADSRQYYRP